MITQSGIWVTPATGLMPSPLDIAIHSGRVTRYAGALWCPLLMHLVLVAEIVWHELSIRPGAPFDYPTWAWALLHDAHEVVMGEIPRRWKIKERKDQENAFDRRLQEAYGLRTSSIDYPVIKAADEIALLAEAVVLKLPGFREKYAEENRLSHFPEPPGAALDMVDALVNSGFYRPEVSTNPDSTPVRGLAQVLAFIKEGFLVTAVDEFRELLDTVLPEIAG